MKFKSCPFSFELNVLTVIVDNKSSYSINSGIVSWNSLFGGQSKSFAVVGIIDKSSRGNLQICCLVSNEANVDGVDLGDSGNRKGHSDSRCVCC